MFSCQIPLPEVGLGGNLKRQFCFVILSYNLLLVSLHLCTNSHISSISVTSGNSWILISSSAHHEARPHLQQPALGSLHPTAGRIGRRGEERGAAGTTLGPLSNNNEARRRAARRRHISFPVSLPARTPHEQQTPKDSRAQGARRHRPACASRRAVSARTHAADQS